MDFYTMKALTPQAKCIMWGLLLLPCKLIPIIHSETWEMTTGKCADLVSQTLNLLPGPLNSLSQLSSYDVVLGAPLSMSAQTLWLIVLE